MMGVPKQVDEAAAPGAARGRSDWALSAGAGVAAQLALAPWWMLGGVLHVAGVHRTGWGIGFGVTAYPKSKETIDGVTVNYGLWTLRSEGCYVALDRSTFRALGCAAFEAGRLTAAGDPGGPIVTGVSGAASWFAAVVIGRVGIPVGRVTIEGQGELLAPLSRNDFGIRTGAEFAGKHQPSVLGFGASLGMAYRFWE